MSPISSVANIMSCRFDALTIGNWLIIWNCVLIVLQILILRKDFKIVQLLQIPLSFVLGIFTDFWMLVVDHIPISHYPEKMACVFAGIIIIALGVTLSVIANVVLNSGEAFVKAISDKTGIVFGNLKVGFDVSCVVLSVVLSFVFFHSLVGTREGTIITAICTGFVVKFMMKRLNAPISKLLVDKKAEVDFDGDLEE